MKSTLLSLAVLFGLVQLGASTASAQEAVARAPAESADTHPVVPDETRWAGVMVLVILVGFFLPAMVVGPIVRSLLGDPEPEPAHDDHASHGHDAHGHDAHEHGH